MALNKLTVLSQMPMDVFEDSIKEQVGSLELDWIYEDETNRDRVVERAADVDVVIGVAHGEMKPQGLHRFTKLKAVLLSGVGYESMTRDMIPDGCIVTNTFEHENPIADWVIMAMLMLSRNAIKIDHQFRDATIRMGPAGAPRPLDMAETTLGVIGLGHIGQRVVDLSNAHGVRCVAAMRTPISNQQAAERGIDAVFNMNQLNEMLAMCDFVLPTVPLIDSTVGLIGEDQYAVMKKGSFIINVARGELLDEAATYRALVDGRLGGGAFDVWWLDDLPGLMTDDPERRRWANYPFWELENVLMSPHWSSFTSLTEARKTRFHASQLLRLAEGKPLLNVIPELSKAQLT